mmetsp:Transcript_39507/g.58046  ORF Transcript_39507/g.58046 Transcript_39507/m.58046 type:complete len:178 (-) Transcript_39507:91-624(-)|eukprot:CAMPEP_0195511004 /NCGR_PEP_ID=MMETSP0794_2-20130614/3478_1 /TAXON_ID=515487 /ORGANISM="Stephanopyxis turris, Strain CCMP 815" /LENGTH=177 /DNA_ID=CAMNT_0040638535 /DNA_START=150 /DNA_END=683 /DNA_ORIENTATION=+
MGYPVKITITRDTDNLVGFCLITSTLAVCSVIPSSKAYRDGVRDGAIVKIADGKPVTCWEDYKALCIGKQQFELVFHFPRMKVWIDAQPQIKDFARRTSDVVVEADGEGAVGYSVRAANVHELKVFDVVKGSVAHTNGLRDGDRVLAVDGEFIAKKPAYEAFVKDHPTFTMTVLRPE